MFPESFVRHGDLNFYKFWSSTHTFCDQVEKKVYVEAKHKIKVFFTLDVASSRPGPKHSLTYSHFPRNFERGFENFAGGFVRKSKFGDTFARFSHFWQNPVIPRVNLPE